MAKFSTRIEKVCEYCNSPFIAKVSRAKYCCPQCKARAIGKSKHVKRDNEGLFLKVCKKCGNDFRTDKKNKYLCESCTRDNALTSSRKYAERKHVEKVSHVCPVCNRQFESGWSNHVFCSKECKAEARRRKEREKYVPTGHSAITRCCRYCESMFVANDPRTKVCDECMRKRRAEQAKKHRATRTPEQREEHRGKVRKREAVKRASRNREIAFRHQEILERTAIRYETTGQLDANMFVDSIGIERLTMNRCRCRRCGCEFFMARSGSCVKKLLSARVSAGMSPCPNCGDWPPGVSTNQVGSSREKEISGLYKNLTERHYRPGFMEGLEIDLYDPVNNVGVEFHGLYSHSDRLSSNPSLHRQKADLAEKAGIQLIQIYESEWVQRRECVIDRLDAVFHREMSRIPARKLTVRILNGEKDHREASIFMEENHIQGKAPFQWGVALMSGDEMVAACFFRYGTGYASGGQKEGTRKYWELNRFATRLHVCVQGGLSRCISAFWKAHPEVEEIFSFADRRWTCPKRSAYSSSGFVEVARQPQNYMYTDLNVSHELKNKQFMRKSAIKERNPEVYSDDRTELQMAHELGYYRIWDAGKIKYRMGRPN